MSEKLKSYESRDGGYMERVLKTPKVGTVRDEQAWQAGYRDYIDGTARGQIFESDHPSSRDYADGFDQAYREAPEV